jgi:NADPH2 dehydrogenase
MTAPTIRRLASIKDVPTFQEYLRDLSLDLPCDGNVDSAHSPLLQPIQRSDLRIGNRIAVNPMEGWDGTPDGNPSDNTVRRWRRFGQSGAKLIWGGEAAAVNHGGRANPNQIVVAPHTRDGLARMREALIDEHKRAMGNTNDLVIGLQLTHSGRYCRPNASNKPEPRILYRHPILDARLKLDANYPVLTDSEVEGIIEDFHRAARIAAGLGFDFVDVKHCHGYLGHEFLSARSRDGKYGGSFENRTRFLREVVAGIRSDSPQLKIGVRLSAFDTSPFHPDSALSSPGKPGPGVLEANAGSGTIPYNWGFGADVNNPSQFDLTEPIQFLSLLQELDITLVNLTAGSPYYNPHIQRPALFPPSDGYQPPEDPLVGVERQLRVTRELKRKFPGLIFTGTAYSYLQDFLPNVAQAAVREGWVDLVGLGRMVLSYPAILLDAARGNPLQHKLVCRTFSDCTTAPRNGLPSGCYPLDAHYKNSPMMAQLAAVKAVAKSKANTWRSHKGST